jgi:glucosylglycerate phosphorylase
LTPFHASDGIRHVWTTFSTDQVDLDYRSPAVLLAVTEALLAYIEAGARIIRLDAIAYLWKELGTSCIHLPQTHEVVRLWRTLVDTVAPGTLLITETNVPHEENVSYFGSGNDEAHLVYQFPLAPLVLSAFHLADSSLLQEWATWLSPPGPTTTYFNFLGSHDGVGVRPAEGYLTASEIRQLCDLAKAHGGGVSYRTHPDGSLSPYELNTVYFDALNPIGTPEPPQVQVDRFLAAQSILLALPGVPGIYIHALLGSRNWHDGVRLTGRLRTINRQKLDRATVDAELDTPGTLRNLVFSEFSHRIRVRRSERAFHPNGPQRIVATHAPLFVFERWSPEGSSKVLCVTNLSGRPQLLDAGRGQGLSVRGPLRDLLTGVSVRVDSAGVLRLDVAPYQVLWLHQEVGPARA